MTPQQAKIIYEDNPMGMLKEICPLMIKQNFTMLVKKNMRGTKESKKEAEVSMVNDMKRKKRQEKNFLTFFRFKACSLSAF